MVIVGEPEEEPRVAEGRLLCTFYAAVRSERAHQVCVSSEIVNLRLFGSRSHLRALIKASRDMALVARVSLSMHVLGKVGSSHANEAASWAWSHNELRGG